MTEIQHVGTDASIETITDILKTDGALIMDDVIDAEFIAALRSETDPYMDATENGNDDFSGRHTTRTGGLLMRSEKCRELIAHPLILKPCEAFLSPYCERVQLHLTQIIRLRPGQGSQMIHRDRWAWGRHLAHIEPQFNTIWAITDFTLENGATQIVPGSVAWPDNRQATAEEISQAVMKAGSVLIYSGSVFHGGGENRSETDRIGINLTYALGWLRQEENQYLACPPELAKTLPPELASLAGYAMGQYALGYYTPPGAPGEHPEVVGPEYALGQETSMNALGSAEALHSATQ